MGSQRERREIADRFHSAAIHLLRHARRADVLAGEGPARLSALSVLVFGGPLTLGQLATAEQVKPPTMTRIVAGMKRAGLATIEPDASDARRVWVRATAKGERLMRRARDRRIEAVAKLLADLTDRDADTVRRAAELMERALRDQSR